MVRRATMLRLATGQALDLPLLVPSFSSKGFDYYSEGSGARKRVYSECSRFLETFGPFLTESFLVSAFDLHFRHFKRPETFFQNAQAILLDSGGYELTPDFDSSEPKMTPRRDSEFRYEDYVSQLDRLRRRKSTLPLVIASFDWGSRGRPFAEQIQMARETFTRYPEWSSSLVLKPPSRRGSVVDVDELVPHMGDLHDFSVIGVTEKELGRGLFDRLRRLTKLRAELTKRDIFAPIHVWGGLDPVVTPLYYFAGADLFDGVSWLRYFYYTGLAVNRESFSILEGSLTEGHDHAISFALNRNISALQGLANSMRAFGIADSPNFGMFDNHQELFRKAFQTMSAKIPELEELY